jgi:hypothetical protein
VSLTAARSPLFHPCLDAGVTESGWKQETLIVLAAALGLVLALVLSLRRHGRLFPRGEQDPNKVQRAESWLTKGSGRG